MQDEIALPIRAAPFAHQRAAYEQALEAFGVRSPPDTTGGKSPPRIRAGDNSGGDGGNENGNITTSIATVAPNTIAANDAAASTQISSRGFALLLEMGCGKSLTAIALAGALFFDNRIRKILVVAPLSITGVWEEEFRKFAAFDYTLAVLEGNGAKKIDTLKHMTGANLQVLVINYESAWRLEKELAAWLKAPTGANGNGRVWDCGDCVGINGSNVSVENSGRIGGGSNDANPKPDKGRTLIIADEAHRMKNHTTAVSKAMHRLGALAGYRLLLTGTVITNQPLDVFSQYKFLNPAIFGTGFYSWRNRYFEAYGFQNKQFRLKRSMENELTTKLHSIAFRATKAECLDLPPTTDIVRHIDLEPAAAKLYRNLVKDSYTELARGGEVTATNVLTRLLRLSQLTGGFLGSDGNSGGRGYDEGNGGERHDRGYGCNDSYGDNCSDNSGDSGGGIGGTISTKPQQVSTAKLEALSDIIETAQESGQKLVIIARFIAEIAAIKRLLEKQGISYAAISGETKDRAEQVSRFQSDPNVTVFIGQISTAGLGITLTAASTLVFYSLNYSMSDFEQAKARIHRVGQTAPCTYIYLVARGTVDAKILDALKNKADVAKMLIDDYRQGANPFG